MKFNHLSLALAGALLAQTASAQVMPELRISTAGTDEEYAEIEGTPSASTDGLMFAVVEGAPTGASGGVGNLDVIFDLSGQQFGADGFFVFGSTAAQGNATFGGEIDFLPAGDNLFENSSGTFYLLSVPDPNDRLLLDSMLNMDITRPMGSLTTLLASTPGVTILDLVAITDGDAGDMFTDGAPVFGPDIVGPNIFLPSGIYRPGGCPSDWCTDSFLNFGTDGVTDPPYGDPSPGAVNPAAMCSTVPSIGVCGGGSGNIGTQTSCMANPTSLGAPAICTATGSATAADNNVTITASAMPPQQFGFFLNSDTQGFAPNIGTNGDGNLCLGGGVGRFVGPGQILNGGAAGEFSLMIDLTQIPRPSTLASINAGETWYFQAWFRDINMNGPSSNLTTAVGVTFN